MQRFPGVLLMFGNNSWYRYRKFVENHVSRKFLSKGSQSSDRYSNVHILPWQPLFPLRERTEIQLCRHCRQWRKRYDTFTHGSRTVTYTCSSLVPPILDTKHVYRPACSRVACTTLKYPVASPGGDGCEYYELNMRVRIPNISLFLVFERKLSNMSICFGDVSG